MRPLVAVIVLSALVFGAACSGPSTAQQGRTSAAAPAAPGAPTVEVVPVVEQKLERSLRLPGELLAYEEVQLRPKISGFLEWIGVDRGSRVKRGQVLARLSAPELVSQRSEAEARLEAVRAQQAEAQARLVAEESTFQRLKAASATPGAISGNELELAEKGVEAARARVAALAGSERAARAAVQSVREMESYLQIAAPFDGVVTERNAHPGTLLGPSAAPLLKLEQISRLRLVVAVPEADVAAVAVGARVRFTVPAFPGESFEGTVRRLAQSLDTRTRTMPVELDVNNPSGRLSPGMFPEATWPVTRARPSLFVPASSIVTTTERVFVVRVRDGKTEWVNVKRGASSGDLAEVFGNLRPGDTVARRGTDELKPGTAVISKTAAAR